MKLRVLFELAANDFKAKYAGSVLGGVWAFISPVVMVLIYWFVFAFAVGTDAASDAPYILWLTSGIAPYLYFAEAFQAETAALMDYSYLCKKMKFDPAALPAVRLISSGFAHMFFIALVFLTAALCGVFGKIRPLTLIYFIVCEICLCAALGYLTSIINAYFKDISSAVSVALLLGYWVTPLFWDISSLGAAGTIFKLNPATYIVYGFREAFGCGSGVIDLGYTAFFWALTAAMGATALFLWRRLRSGIPDVV